MAKRSDQAPLDAVRIVLKSCSILLKPIDHQVSALPPTSDLEYYFVSAEHMNLFSPYHRPGQPYKNLKLINFDRPAIALNFYNKHKYHITRDVHPEKAQEILTTYRNELYNRSFLDQLSPGQEQELQRIDTLVRSLRQTPEQFQLSISNYHQYYRYWYCSFRYFEDPEQTKTGTSNEHMLKHTERNYRQPDQPMRNERLNIIFVDTNYITRPVAYDNKFIDRELATYLDRIPLGLGALYIKALD